LAQSPKASRKPVVLLAASRCCFSPSPDLVKSPGTSRPPIPERPREHRRPNRRNPGAPASSTFWLSTSRATDDQTPESQTPGAPQRAVGKPEWS